MSSRKFRVQEDDPAHTIGAYQPRPAGKPGKPSTVQFRSWDAGDHFVTETRIIYKKNTDA